MKNISALLLLISLAINGISQNHNKQVYFHFTVKNATSDSIMIKDINYLSTKHILLNNGIEDTSFLLTEKFYYFGNENYRLKVFLSPGDSLWISLDEKNVDSSIVITGNRAEFDSYWIEKNALDLSIIKQRFVLLDENVFLTKVDSAKEVRLDLFEKYSPHFSQKEKELAIEQIKYQAIYDLATYQGLHRFYTKNDTFKVSENYPDPLKDVDSNNELAANHYEYLNTLTKMVYTEGSKRIRGGDTLDRNLIHVQAIDSIISNKKVKSEMTYMLINRNITKSKNPKELIEIARNSITDSLQLSSLEEKYKNVVLTKVGNPSPSFTFKNIDGEEVSLEDFKGSVVYIDIWATWCAPCIAEIPNLEKLQDTLEGKAVVFVSISYSDNHERWKKMVDAKNLGGVQLFSEDSNDSFFDNYSVSGIPRFILLDQNLKIIAANADRPSNPNLQKQIEELLEK
tara:strand:+ start:1249 stop:2613 length:1365 start_codon:yes stop_codon:yes gene_type:complete